GGWHAEPDNKGAEEEGGAGGRVAPAEIGPQGGNGHDDDGRYGDKEQDRQQAARVPMEKKSAPRSGEAELGLEKGEAECEAENNERSRMGLTIDQHQRNEDAGGEDCRDEKGPIDRTPSLCGKGCGHALNR